MECQMTSPNITTPLKVIENQHSDLQSEFHQQLLILRLEEDASGSEACHTTISDLDTQLRPLGSNYNQPLPRP